MTENNTYFYLKKYISDHSIDGNWFVPVYENEILEAEKRLGYYLPNELKKFYLEVGSGFLAGGANPPASKVYSLSNHIFSPKQLADLVLLGPESGLIIPPAWEYMTPGDLPFFEIGDSESFLVMKPQGESPNAVYSTGSVLVEKDFSKFIWKLYYESPSYYNEVIMSYYDNLPQ